MKHNSRGRKGQFSIIAALLIAIIMVSAVIMTYATIRNFPFQESPKVLSSIEEMNMSLKQLLEFAVGYYGSVLQMTGNVTYAKELTSRYLQSGFTYIAHSYPQWNPSFEITDKSLNLSTRWYEPASYSIGNLSVSYSLSGLGISKITYQTSSLLKVEILETVANQSKVRVTREEDKPDLTLSKENFFFYNYSDSTWKLINPTTEPTVFSNGTYLVPIPSGVEQSSYLLKVSDSRSVMVMVFFSNSKKPQYEYTFTWDGRYSSLTRDTIVVEALQNGTLRWLGQNLQLSTPGKPIPPLPVRALHVNQTVNGISREVPFQVEDWGSNYRVPLGLTSNASLFSDRQMIVFLVNHNVQNVTLWWDGRDTATQTSYAWTCRYFTGDNPSQRKLTNGNLTITISSDYSTITSSVTGGSITSTASFMRINGKDPTYGAGPSYVIYHGIVRDIVQQEAEWSGGILKSSGATEDCPNVYSQLYFTLPANATYYTYALRLIFMQSSQSRKITELRAIRLSVSGGSQRTENGTSGGYPNPSSATGLFYNFTSASFSTGWAHHWSEFISGSSGAGIMFTDSANQKLYVFDNIAGQKTGALNVITSGGRFIDFNPVARSSYPASFTYPLDVTWHGAVVTFGSGYEPIYPGPSDWTRPAAIYDRCGETSPYVASRAIDGSTSSPYYWQHSNADNHWIELDMGQTMNISQIRIYQYTGFGSDYYRWGYPNGVDVYVSNDPTNWGSAVWSGTLNSGGWQSSGVFSAIGRYVRLYSRSTDSRQRFYEVEVNAAPSGNTGLWVIVEYPPTVAVN